MVAVMAAASAPPVSAPRSPLALLGANPRFALLSLVMLMPAMSFGAVGVARVREATYVFGGVAGIGTIATVAALAAGVAAIPAGAIADAINPRIVFVVASFLGALVNIVGTVLAMRDALQPGQFMMLAAFDGAIAAINSTSVVPMQMSLVDSADTGAAQIVHVVRLSVGALVGTIVANVFSNTGTVVLVSSALLASSSLIAWFLVRPSAVQSAGRARRHTRASIGDVFRVIGADHGLRNAIVVMLAMNLVVPTQLVAVVLADNQLSRFSFPAAMAGLIGALGARLVLMKTGLALPVTRTLRTTFGFYTALTAFGAILLWFDALLGRLPLVVIMVFLGTAASSITLEFTSALVQQTCPDDIRGRITGLLTSARALMTAIGATLATSIQISADEPELVTVLALAALAVLVGSRGFSRIPDPSRAA